MTSRENRDEPLDDASFNSSRDFEINRTSATVVALFTDRDDASEAISDLREAGFQDDDIGIAMQDGNEQSTLTDETGAKPAEGAAKGALSGGIVGGALGLLGSLLIPGVGPIMAGGVLGTILAGAGIGAATGGIIGALVGMGISKEAAEHFDRGFREGGVLVTVRANDRSTEARAILRDRNGDLGPSYQGSELADPTRAGTIIADENDDPTIMGTTTRRNEWVDAETDGDDLDDDADLEMLDVEVESWSGRDRRVRQDLSYSGPERRVAPF